MVTVTLKSSKQKIDLLLKVAKEMGIDAQTSKPDNMDEVMALPGGKVSKRKIKGWLKEDDGEEYGLKEAFDIARKALN
jgi:hypothetical protein